MLNFERMQELFGMQYKSGNPYAWAERINNEDPRKGRVILHRDKNKSLGFGFGEDRFDHGGDAAPGGEIRSHFHAAGPAGFD